MKRLFFYVSAMALMFSSCTKDAELVAPQSSGIAAFSASIAVEDEPSTRLHLEGSSYVWDVNDAIGVASPSMKDANLQVATTVGGRNAAFSVAESDYDRWLSATAESKLFVYFPYKEGTEFTTDGKVSLSIPAEQRYEENSFYRNSVNAVGYISKYNGSEQTVDLKVPTALIRVNVIGLGKTDENGVTLTIQDKDGNYYKLNGSAQVDVKATTPSLSFTPATTSSADEYKLKVTFGLKAENLDYFTPVPVHFIVPAGLNLSQATLTLTNGASTFTKKMPKAVEANAMVIKPNMRVTIGEQVKFGLENKFVVVASENYTAEEQFMAFAYLARPGVASSPFTEEKIADYKYAAKVLGLDNVAKAAATSAVIVPSTLDFAAYTKDAVKAKADALNEALTALHLNMGIDDQAKTALANEYIFWRRVYNWYVANGGAIEPISYNSVVGSKYDEGKSTTIKNLTVLGSGFSGGASLKNLVLENITVKSVKNQNAGLLAYHNELKYTVYGGTETAMTIENVVIGTGNKVVANESAYVGGIYAIMDRYDNGLNNNKITVANTITVVDDGKSSYVGKLFGYVRYGNISLRIADYNPDNTSLPLIGLVKQANVYAKGATDAMLGRLNAGVVGATEDASSVIVNGVSYWNGKVATSIDNEDGFFTAEELAFTVINTGVEVNLTHNIDMQGDDAHNVKSGDVYVPYNVLKVDRADRATTVNGNNKVISNINFALTDVGQATLFGNNADIKNITFDGLVVNTKAESAYSVAGLAHTGKADNVVIKNVEVNVTGENWNVNHTDTFGIGAIFANADIKDIKNVTVNGCKINSAVATSAGLVAGVLKISGNYSEISGINVLGTNQVTVNGVKAMTLSKTAKQVEAYKAGSPYAFTSPFGSVLLVDASFPVGSKGIHELTVENSSYGDKFAAGYWVVQAFRNTVESVKPSANKADLKECGYVFSSNANANNSAAYNNIGFIQK